MSMADGVASRSKCYLQPGLADICRMSKSTEAQKHDGRSKVHISECMSYKASSMACQRIQKNDIASMAARNVHLQAIEPQGCLKRFLQPRVKKPYPPGAALAGTHGWGVLGQQTSKPCTVMTAVA